MKKARCRVLFVAPQVGLEPTTLRLTEIDYADAEKSQISKESLNLYKNSTFH